MLGKGAFDKPRTKGGGGGKKKEKGKPLFWKSIFSVSILLHVQVKTCAMAVQYCMARIRSQSNRKHTLGNVQVGQQYM